MSAPRNQVFLERRSYRLRRLGDAARMLPVLAMVLFLLPLFWAPETADTTRMTVGDGLYLFVVWVGLIGLAALLSRHLVRMVSVPENGARPDGMAAAENRSQE